MRVQTMDTTTGRFGDMPGPEPRVLRVEVGGVTATIVERNGRMEVAFNPAERVAYELDIWEVAGTPHQARVSVSGKVWP